VPSLRVFLRALVPFAVYGLAREVDEALGLVLRSTLVPASVPLEVLRVLAGDLGEVVRSIALWTAGGALVWLLMASLRARGDELGLGASLGRLSAAFRPLYLRPALSLLALIAVTIRPTFPYAFTLPVALTQDWSLGQDAAALATIMATVATPLRFPAPRPRAVLFVSFLLYAFLTPEWARRWEGHPGNEPKYLRMAVAIGHEGTLDAEGVSAPMEELAPRPWTAIAGRAIAGVVTDSADMMRALVAGPTAVGKDAIRATRITRQTIRGKEGGVYYVLAPGPSLLLAPALRFDRALNIARGTPGRVPIAILVFNLLAGALAAAVFVLARDTTGRPGLAATLALGFALLPPFVFYGYQFYPEMPGALVMAVVFHRLVFVSEWTTRAVWATALLLAFLPWLHQKFLPVWMVLVLAAAWRLRGAPRARWVALLVPQAVTLYLTALYNFAITGSVRPDALFLAWGPGGVSSARVGQGVLGLLFDARYGILPYVPIFLLAGAGELLGGLRRFALVAPAAVVYYLTVASADNWAGAVSNLGRYFMPLAPFAVALVALAVDRMRSKRGALALVLILAAFSALVATALFADPHAANDSAVLLAKSTFADGNQYLPNLHLREWSEAAPGLWARVVVWVLLASGLAAWWASGVARDRWVGSPARTLTVVMVMLLVAGLLLERWPSPETAPRFHEAIEIGPDATVFLDGPATVQDQQAVLRAGETRLTVRSTTPRTAIRAVLGGRGVLRPGPAAPIPARPAGALVALPVESRHILQDAEGRAEYFSETRLRVEGEVVLRFGDAESASFIH
jgi:hypothetical protein